MTQWDELDEYDRAWMLAVHVADAEEEAKQAREKCPACGGPRAECQDHDNQHAFVVSASRCYRTRAVDDTKKARRSDPDLGSTLFASVLDPQRKKSARRKG